MQSTQLNKEFNEKSRCLECNIRPHSFCRCLQEEKLKEFSNISSEKKFQNKANIFLQQDDAKNIYNITEGNVKIYQLIDDGRIQIIGFLYPGDFFGSYKNGKYNYCAEAIGQVRVCVFEQKKLDEYIDKNMVLAKELLNQTSHELTLAQDRMGVLGKLDATERLTKFLINISDQRKRIGWQNNPISLPMTRQDIADYLGLTIETVSREVSKLKTSNIVKVLSSKQIYINDFDKLSNLSK
ncbi:Crp/Fnr family transcriptional regulator [Candidatus Pelagibacter bacterium nBUS_29]|uniref:Crp/Fnr family transcriptional regulator n=1 Tax=Candidatus Pelagibacter bacterium nBUS_29 TaxID=3374190 RepID=UPI003EC121C4